jgi:L-fuconolactonase
VIVDTHVHVVAPDQTRYPLRPSGLVGAGDWYRESPVGVEEFLRLAAEAGVDRDVLVQPFSAYGSDNRYTVDAARAHADRVVSVVIVDMDDRAAATLRTLVEDDGARGVRLFAIGNPTLSQLDAPATFPVWELAGELDLPVIVTILPAQLSELARVLERFYECRVALDHCGFPDLTGGPPYPRATELFGLARFANLSLKVSSHLLENAEAAGDPRDLVDALAAAFGTDRLLWGSDFPQTHDRPYAALVDLGRHACSRLTAAEQTEFLATNALTLWPQLR